MTVLGRIEAFTRRSLTYESDVLNAMLGIFASLGHSNGLRHLWGLPYCDNDLFGSDKTPLNISHRRFVSNLSWDVESPARRRVEFPSWSWTGWEGTVRWARGLKMLDNARLSRDKTEISCAVKPELNDGKIVDWKTYQTLYDSITQAPTIYIHISAHVTRIMPLPLPQSQRSRSYYLEPDPKISRIGLASTFIDVEPTAHDLPSFLLESYVLHLPWYFRHGHDREHHVLVVQCRGSHWERIGTGTTSTLLEAAPVKKRWMDIRLG